MSTWKSILPFRRACSCGTRWRLVIWLACISFSFVGRMLACALSGLVWLQKPQYLDRVVLPRYLLSARYADEFSWQRVHHDIPSHKRSTYVVFVNTYVHFLRVNGFVYTIKECGFEYDAVFVAFRKMRKCVPPWQKGARVTTCPPMYAFSCKIRSDASLSFGVRCEGRIAR